MFCIDYFTPELLAKQDPSRFAAQSAVPRISFTFCAAPRGGMEINMLSSVTAALVFLTGGFFTVRFRAFYALRPVTVLRAMPLENGVSQMLLSLGGTVGVGNIVGVAVALSIGGAGAVLWMWAGAFFSMALKYAEITLGMLTRRKINGETVGGAAVYIKDKLGSVAALLFSILLICDCIMTGGVVQSSAIAESVSVATGASPVAVGIMLSVTVAAVFFLKVDVFRLSVYVVPLMSLGYAVFALCIIAANISSVPPLFSKIFSSAFSFDSAAGGVLGIFAGPALKQGIVKGLFSNEAGVGTAPSAHIASAEREPCRQALFGIFEVFVDTVLMCTLTAFSILLALGDVTGKSGGASICAAAFESVFGSTAPLILAVFISLFAFCTVISFGYYGMQSLSFFGARERAKNVFMILYCISLFAGAVAAPSIIWEICDRVVCLMLIINSTADLLSQNEICTAHKKFYVHIGKYASSASRTRSRSSLRTKNDIPISEKDKNRGEIS